MSVVSALRGSARRSNWMLRGLTLGVLLTAGCMSTSASPQNQQARPAAAADARPIPSPKQVLGFAPGDRPVRYDELVRYMQALDAATDRVALRTHGMTHEGRTLYHLIITSSANHARLDAIRADNAKLADPRTLSEADAAAIIDRLPAIAWLAYCIHGDEISPTDSALEIMHRLASGEDDATKRLRDELVMIIDPLQNPDGRERYLANLQTFIGKVPNNDYQAMQHGALWTAGRTNHYLFDMNRDWLPLTQPESRGRVAALSEWNPHFQVDSHEMGSLDTYLFDPPREPINPRYSANNLKWRKKFSQDQGGAFDQQAWSYYTREWLDDWYPGYTNAWANLTGAVSLLYEQSGVAGQSVMQPHGKALTYQLAVEQNVVSTMANIETLRANRREILRDFVADNRACLAGEFLEAGSFLLPPHADLARHQRFVELLKLHRIEYSITAEAFNAANVTDIWGGKHEAREMPAGTLIVKAAQPRGRLLRSMLDFDPRMTDAFLVDERRDLEQDKGTRSYDITAWNIPMAYGLEGFWAKDIASPALRPADNDAPQPAAQAPAGAAGEAQTTYGWIIDVMNSDSMRVAGRLLQAGVKVRAAIEPFTFEGRRFAQGTLLVRRIENSEQVHETLRSAINETSVVSIPARTALVDDGPDLGGQRFALLQKPRIAIASQWPVSSYSFGSTWYMVDERMRLPCSPINIQTINGIDLRRYNVLILPDGGRYGAVLTSGALETFKAWIEAGGTLIAMGNAATFLANEKSGLSAVRLRSNVLDELNVYAEAVGRERDAWRVTVDPAQVWDGVAATQASAAPAPAVDGSAEPVPAHRWAALAGDELKRWDEWATRFSPQGAFLRTQLNPDVFLAFGLGTDLPVLFAGEDCFLSRPPVQTAARFVEAKDLRLGGLLWPEARHRIADSAAVTRESLGNGQVILFAGDPFFRAFMEGTGRMLQNAIIYGPGMGANAPVPWE